MKPKIWQKNNPNNKNVKRAAFIKYKLSLKGFKIKDIANELNINSSAVTRSLYSESTIKRVDNWLKDNIGLEV